MTDKDNGSDGCPPICSEFNRMRYEEIERLCDRLCAKDAAIDRRARKASGPAADGQHEGGGVMTKDNTMPPRDVVERVVRHQFDTLGAGAGTQFTLEYEGAYYKVTAVRLATVKRTDGNAYVRGWMR